MSKSTKELVRDFAEAQQEFDAAKKKFDGIKGEFYDRYEKAYNSEGLSQTESYDNGHYVVTRVQKVSISFDVPKLEKLLTKDQALQVIDKTYTVADITGLIKYMKSLGADPMVFKSFLSVSKAVNEKALDQLEAIGELDGKSLENCYTVTKKAPYFRLRVKGSAKDGNEGGKE